MPPTPRTLSATPVSHKADVFCLFYPPMQFQWHDQEPGQFATSNSEIAGLATGVPYLGSGLQMAFVNEPVDIRWFGATAQANDWGDNGSVTATIPGGTITAVNLTNNGGGYTSVPTVILTGGGGGTGAAATAVIEIGYVDYIYVTGRTGTYTSAPAISFTGGGGTGAAAFATVVAGQITTITITNTGTGYTSPPTVTFTGGGGDGTCSGYASIKTGTLKQINVTAGGSGYTLPPSVTISGGGGQGAAATAVNAGSAVTALTLNQTPTDYTSAPTVSFIGGGGTGAAATANLTGGTITSLTLTSGGSGYTSPPIVIFSGGGTSSLTAGFTHTYTSVGVYYIKVMSATQSGSALAARNMKVVYRPGTGPGNTTGGNLVASKPIYLHEYPYPAVIDPTTQGDVETAFAFKFTIRNNGVYPANAYTGYTEDRGGVAIFIETYTNGVKDGTVDLTALQSSLTSANTAVTNARTTATTQENAYYTARAGGNSATIATALTNYNNALAALDSALADQRAAADALAQGAQFGAIKLACGGFISNRTLDMDPSGNLLSGVAYDPLFWINIQQMREQSYMDASVLGLLAAADSNESTAVTQMTCGRAPTYGPAVSGGATTPGFDLPRIEFQSSGYIREHYLKSCTPVYAAAHMLQHIRVKSAPTLANVPAGIAASPTMYNLPGGSDYGNMAQFFGVEVNRAFDEKAYLGGFHSFAVGAGGVLSNIRQVLESTGAVFHSRSNMTFVLDYKPFFKRELPLASYTIDVPRAISPVKAGDGLPLPVYIVKLQKPMLAFTLKDLNVKPSLQIVGAPTNPITGKKFTAADLADIIIRDLVNVGDGTYTAPQWAAWYRDAVGAFYAQSSGSQVIDLSQINMDAASLDPSIFYWTQVVGPAGGLTIGPITNVFTDDLPTFAIGVAREKVSHWQMEIPLGNAYYADLGQVVEVNLVTTEGIVLNWAKKAFWVKGIRLNTDGQKHTRTVTLVEILPDEVTATMPAVTL